MRLTLTAFALFAIATAASAATDAELKTMILGNWADTEVCSDGYLEFNADGTFLSKAPEGSPPDADLKGTYTILGGQLNGTAGGEKMPTMAIAFDAGKLVMGEGNNADKLMHCK